MKHNEHKKTGTTEYASAVARFLRRYGKKAREGALDTESLVQLVELREILDQQTCEVVHALRSTEGGSHSWAEIGRALGMTRAAARNKYGSTELDARKVGGQPGALR